MKDLKYHLGLLTKYALAGTIALSIDLAVFWVLIYKLGIFYLPAVVISYFVADIVNYLTHHIWTFKGTRRGIVKGYVAFTGVNLVAILLTAAILSLLIELFGMNPLLARVITSIIVGFGTFIANSTLTFEMWDNGKSDKKYSN